SQIGNRRIACSWGRGKGLLSARVTRRGQHLGIQAPRAERPATLGAREPYFRGTEEQGVDLVEVALVPLEDFVERCAVVAGCGRRDLGRQLRQLRVARANRGARLPTVEDTVVGPTDGAQVVLGHGGDRRGAYRADHAPDV